MSINAFAIAAGQNTGGKHDATGAFLPAAQKFGVAYNCPWRQFDNSGPGPAVRKRFFDTIYANCPGGTNLFAYFGHGIAGGLPSANVYGSDIDDLLNILGPKIAKPFVAVLYACSAGTAQDVSGSIRRCQFDSPFSTWTLQSGRDIDAPPEGQVKAVDPKKPSNVLDQGTWNIRRRSRPS